MARDLYLLEPKEAMYDPEPFPAPIPHTPAEALVAWLQVGSGQRPPFSRRHMPSCRSIRPLPCDRHAVL